MVLDAALLKTQNYKVWINGKVEQSRESSVVANEKGAFRSPSTTVANFTLLFTFPKGISQKGNALAHMGFKLANYDVAD